MRRLSMMPREKPWWRLRLRENVRGDLKQGGNIQASKVVGKTIAERAKAKGIEAVVFDRGGYLYHGRIKAVAEAARESGLKF